MKVIISRTYNSNETLGTLMVMDGERPVYSCKSLELPYNGNQRNTSCIPEGTYEVIKSTSQGRGNVFRFLNVPDRDGILIHIGNYAAGKRVDTQGCILPGRYFVDINNDGIIDVAESTIAMNKLWEVLPDKFVIVII